MRLLLLAAKIRKRQLQRYDAALEAYRQASGLEKPAATERHIVVTRNTENSSGWDREELRRTWAKRYEEQLGAIERRLARTPTAGALWKEKASLLRRLQRQEETLAAYERAIELEPSNPGPYFRKGSLLMDLKRYAEALGTYEQVVLVDPRAAGAYLNKGWALCMLERYQEALFAYEGALRLAPDCTSAARYKRMALERL